MRLLLNCNQDPRALGIEDGQGNWNYNKFREHIKTCPKCARFSLMLTEDMLDNLERAFEQKQIGGEQ